MVEGDAAPGREVRVEVVAEFPEQDHEFVEAAVDLVYRRDVRRIDEDRAGRAHRVERVLEHRVRLLAVARNAGSRHADTRAAQSVRVKELGVVGEHLVPVAARRGVARVAGLAGDRAEHRGSVGDGARVRADRVLRMRDRDDARARHQADRRLDAHDTVGVRRADDRAIRLGADGHRRQVRGRRRARPRARPTRVAIERVRVVALTAAAAPAAR